MAAVEKVNEVPAPTDPVLVIASDGLAVCTVRRMKHQRSEQNWTGSRIQGWALTFDASITPRDEATSDSKNLRRCQWDVESLGNGSATGSKDIQHGLVASLDSHDGRSSSEQNRVGDKVSSACTGAATTNQSDPAQLSMGG